MTIIYYTSNWLEKTNPFFLENTKRQLSKAIGDLPMVCVSHTPVKKFTRGKYKNVVIGKKERSHLLLYSQILQGVKEAKTKYVAMAEDDILYSESHFYSQQIKKEFDAHGDVFLYDMNKVSIFTWTDPPIFSFRSKRKVVNQLIAPRDMLADSLEERFRRFNELKKQGRSTQSIIKYWGDPGRYEGILGVTKRKTVEFFSQSPSIVFTHPEAFGYLNHGSRKRHGDIKIVELLEWGKAEDIMKLWGEAKKK